MSSFNYYYYSYTDSTSSTNWPPTEYYTRSKLSGNEVKKLKPKEEKTSFVFDPKGIGEEWPKKKSQ